jgi:DNA polymerase-3 subunit epsilon
MALSKLSLRVRIFLFFALMALGAIVLILGGLLLGYMRLDQPQAMPGFMIAGLVAGLTVLGLTTWVWLLFDENVAKPVEGLAAQLRTRAHTDASHEMDVFDARYLGDLAGAAHAMAGSLADTREELTASLARETRALRRERARLEAVLDNLPDAYVLCSEDRRVVAYNAAAYGLTVGDVEVGLNRRLPPAPDRRDVRKVELPEIGTGYLVRLGAGPKRGHGARDFRLLGRPSKPLDEHCLLRDLDLVVFDTETTGLLPDEGDEIVQIAALRVVGGEVLTTEPFDTYVNPNRPIPAASTAIHQVTEDMVKDAPLVRDALRSFHRYIDGHALVAHNAPFDMTFLRRRETQLGLRFDNPVIDTVLLSAVVFGQSQTHTLDALCERLGITIPEDVRHTALGDARATAFALRALIPMLEAQGITTVRALNAACDQHARLLKRVT